MKKSMIAILLSLTILCSSMFCVKRASASAAIAGGFSIFFAAWEMLDLMTKGEVPGFVQVLQWCGERVADGAVLTWEFFTDPDGAFQQAWGDFWENWASGYETICDYLGSSYEVDASNLFDSNGNLKLSYDEYYEMYRQAVNVMSKPDVSFTAGYDYTFLSCNLNSPIIIRDLPTMSLFYTNSNGEAYVPFYFNSDRAIFCGNYFVNTSNLGSRLFSNFSQYKGTVYGNDTVFKNIRYRFTGLSEITINDNVFPEATYTCNTCAVFENNILTYQDISSIDTTGMNSGLITTTGLFRDFLKSIKGFSASEGNGSKLDDLSSALPTDKNPSLTFPIDYDYTKPAINQVIVGDVPGAADLPVSDYLKAASVPAAAPPAILNKFPFCIPYDLVRFFGFLAADPIPPVFHIPISTNPENLAQWADNETVGQYVAPDDPMFEIDEEIVIDFANIPLVQPICYTCFIIGFVIMLIHITPKLIHH